MRVGHFRQEKADEHKDRDDNYSQDVSQPLYHEPQPRRTEKNERPDMAFPRRTSNLSSSLGSGQSE